MGLGEEYTMMTEEDKLYTAQDFIIWKLQKMDRRKTIDISWIRDKTDLASGTHRLKVFAGTKKVVFTFTTDELTKWYDYWKWEKIFLRRVQEILAEIGVRECKRQPLPAR